MRALCNLKTCVGHVLMSEFALQLEDTGCGDPTRVDDTVWL